MIEFIAKGSRQSSLQTDDVKVDYDDVAGNGYLTLTQGSNALRVGIIQMGYLISDLARYHVLIVGPSHEVRKKIIAEYEASKSKPE